MFSVFQEMYNDSFEMWDKLQSYLEKYSIMKVAKCKPKAEVY